MLETVIEVQDVTKSFSGRVVLRDLSFRVNRGDTLVVMGASGCGKSTVLRLINGSMKPDCGSIKIFGSEITDISPRDLDRLRMRFGMNFQFGGLLQSLTVGENVALPLRENSRVDPAIIDLIVKMKLELVGLTGFSEFMPSEISGGMRKRVALARAVALDPELLFSDEPTSGLDPIMTAVIDRLTMDLTRKLGMTAVVVSHDMTSAFRIADQMIVLGNGRHQGEILAMGTPDDIRKSDHPDVQQFINGEPDGPTPLNMTESDYFERLLGTSKSKAK